MEEEEWEKGKEVAHERKGRSIKAGGISGSVWDEQEQQEREGDQREGREAFWAGSYGTININ